MNDPRKTVKLQTAKKKQLNAEDLFHVFMASMGILFVLYIIVAPKRSPGGSTKIDIFFDTVWLLIVVPTGIVFMYWTFRKILNEIFWGIVDVLKFFIAIMIKFLKLLIRCFCDISTTLKKIEQWSRER
jgi:hypothetical protein